MRVLLILPLLAACGSERGVRAAPTDVTYSGWVYTSPAVDTKLEDGTVSFTLGDGTVVQAEEPYPDYLGYWQATLTPSAPFTLRIEADGAYPTVWAGDAPGADGSWLAYELFAGDPTTIDAVLARLELPFGRIPASPADGALDLWGAPLDGSDWDCATVQVQGARPFCFTVADDGTVTRVDDGPFDWFFAFDLSPGDITVEDGFGGSETWPAQAGDLVMASWLVHA